MQQYVQFRDLREDSLLEFQMMQKGHVLWDKTISFAQSCSWKAGACLAERMKSNAFKDWERVVAAVENETIVGCCTFSERDELSEDYDYSPFIGFVFVDERHRGRRISEKMIQQVLSYAKSIGYQAVYIMSGEQGLYEKYGFEKTGVFHTIYGTTDQLFHIDLQTDKFRLPGMTGGRNAADAGQGI